MSTSFHNSLLAPAQVSVGPAISNHIDRSYPATESQLEIWLSSLQGPEANCSYNEISSLVLDGDLNADVLQTALQQVAIRNASLRTTFSPDGQTARVLADVNHDMRFVDFSRLNRADALAAQDAIVKTEACKPFDLEQGPLLRCVLQKVSDTCHKLTFTAHHIIMDGWSLAVFCRDLGKIYDSIIQGQPERPAGLPIADQYEDYSKKMDAYLASAEGAADEAFWVDQFSDAIPVLDLPTTGKRPAVRTWSGGRHDHLFPAELMEGVRKIGAKSGCSLFNVMLSAFSAWVARISGNGDFCVGIPTAGQAAMDSTELVGHCVNVLPWRTAVDTNTPFVDYMKASRRSLLDALDHQRYAYGTLLRKLAPPRDPSRAPMLSISFNVDPVIDTSEMGFTGLELEVQIEPRSFENFEWFVNGVIQKDKSVEMQIQYNSDLFSPEAMQFWFEGFEAFLSAVVDIPEAIIANLPLMSVDQRQRTIVDFNSTSLHYPTTTTLSHEFARQATATPDNLAVTFEDQSLTYAEVDARSSQIARYLSLQGVGAGDLVGICVNRSAEMLVNLYAILKTGAGYVPLDPAYPADRLEYMCSHSGLKLIVTESELTARVEQFDKPMIVIDTAIEEINQQSASPVDCPATPADICYVIYTSGSTGKPKGVQVPHGAVVNFLYSMKQQPGLTSDDSLLAVTTLSFDIAVLELYLPTIVGGQVVIVDAVAAANGDQLSMLLEKHGITVLQATPATWRLMIGAGWRGKSDLKVLCGGEPMPADLVDPLLQRCGQLWNMYGPTETTVWSAVYQITDADAPILIGQPIGNTQIYILDAFGNEVPVGCPGEVYIGGAGVTRGYRNRQDLTDERFVSNRYRNPFAQYVSDKIYKTGDLARYRFDGNIEFLRRNDKQVKVRGFRIELGEIETALGTHPAIEHNVVIVREDMPGDTRLVAYCIFKSGQDIVAGQLKDHLRSILPYYMIPQNVVTLDEMPQTNNGKIDYNALPAPKARLQTPVNAHVGGEASDGLGDGDCDHRAMARTPAERFLAAVWQDVLETEHIELNDNFFDIGGHSLLVMRVIAAVKAKTGFALGPQDFLIGTLEQLADKFAEQFPAATETTDSSTSPVATADKSKADDRQVAKISQPNGGIAIETKSPESKTVSDSPAISEDGSGTKVPKRTLKSLKGFWKR